MQFVIEYWCYSVIVVVCGTNSSNSLWWINMQNISASTKVNEILKEYPELTDYLMELGLCRADAGPDSILSWPLSRAAEDKNLDLQSLLDELNRRI